MNAKQKKTLSRIFETPTRTDITWGEVESLLAANGATIEEGRGARKRIVVRGQILRIHTPHPQKEFKRYAIGDIRTFLENVGIVPS